MMAKHATSILVCDLFLCCLFCLLLLFFKVFFVGILDDSCTSSLTGSGIGVDFTPVYCRMSCTNVGKRLVCTIQRESCR